MLRLWRKPKHLMPEWVREQVEEMAGRPSTIASVIGTSAHGGVVEYAGGTPVSLVDEQRWLLEDVAFGKHSSAVHVLPADLYNEERLRNLREHHRQAYVKRVREVGEQTPSLRDLGLWWPETGM